MKKRIYIGLIAITIVFVLGGVIISRIIDRLYSVNYARFLADDVYHITIRLGIVAMQGIQESSPAITDEFWIERTSKNVDQIQVLIDTLNERVVSSDLAHNSCGLCHDNPMKLVVDLHDIIMRMEDAFTQLNSLVDRLETENPSAPSMMLVTDIGRSFERYETYVEDIRRVILPMVDHTNKEIAGYITRTRKIHDITVILVTLLILAGMLIIVTTVTQPLKKLTEGTEAIVKGDYDFRIKMEGNDEAALLADRFNYMAEVLSNREQNLYQKTLELEELNQTLERKVRERTKALQEKQEELNRKYAELESVNDEMQASYLQLKATTGELEAAQAKLQENYNVLKMMNKEFQRANEVKNKFLSIMSHELRTPLTVINGYLSLVLDKDYGRPGSELRDLLKVVKEQGQSQLSLIEDLLDLTRIEAGEFKLNKLSLEVDDLISKAVENFRPKYEEKNIEVTVDVEEGMPTVYWDFQKMLQVFQNLLDNALKFTSEGGEINIQAQSKSDFVELRVSDNGIGIPNDQIDRVFERFYQVDSSSTRRFGGSGLGLSIVREIILAHRGKIFVESEEGKGTCFLILLPVGELDRTRMIEQPRDGTGGDARAEEPKGNGEMILVVDDDEAFLKMMKMILPKEGYKVASTPESTKVVEMAREHHADLVMLDLMMPEIDGFEVCRQLRKDPELGHMPILVVSAAGSDEVGRKVFEAGADEYITKPFDQRDLLHHINRLIKSHIKHKGEDVGGGENNSDS